MHASAPCASVFEPALRIGELDVSLDSVVLANQQGYVAETIQQLYPALTLEEVYGAIAFYLANRDINEYLVRQEGRWQQLRQSASGLSPVVARLRALAQAPTSPRHEPTAISGRQ